MSTPSSAEGLLGRPVWNGSITFGLVAVPVKLYSATEGHSGPVTHQYHATDLGRIRYRKFCEAEDRELRPDEIARGQERGGNMVVLTDDDMEQLPLPTKHVIDVHAFLDEKSISSLAWDSPYYVGLGDKAPAKPYRLLAEALRESGQVAVTKVALRDRESLAVLRERDGLLILQTIRWPDEIRSPKGIPLPGADEEPIHANEIRMAQQLMASMSEGYDLEAERDQYVQAMEQLLAAKAGGGEVERGAEPAAAAAPPVDLMAALQASIAESQAKRGETPAPAKKSAAKTAAKKAPAKRTTRKAG